MSKIIKILEALPAFSAMKAPETAQIEQAEATLGLKFSEDYREYVSTLGVVSYDGHELSGICSSPRLSVVNITQREKEKISSIPSDWYVIEQTNIDGIVIWQDATGAVYQTMPGAEPQRICNSLCEYIEL